jgi:hypothetical protein
MVDLQGNRIRTIGPRRKRGGYGYNGGNMLDTPGEYQAASGNQRGQHIVRRVKTSQGLRDLAIDGDGNVTAILRPGSKAVIRRGANGQVVVGLPTPGNAAAPGVAGGSSAAPPKADNLTTWNYGFKPNKATLDARFGPDGYTLAQVGNKWVVTKKPAAPAAPAAPVDPYADYPWIKSYLNGLDTGYGKIQSYFKDSLIPNVTAGTTALGNLTKSVSGAYQGMINNYAGSAGNVASGITTAQVAGSSGSPVVAPNQNALGAAQSLAATAKTGRDLAAGYQSTLDQLGAEKIGASTIAYVANYSSGLLTQYATKKNDEMMRLNMWIEEQKAASAKAAYQQQQDSISNEIKLRGQDINTQNALIMSGDRQAAINATTRGQDVTARTARASQAAADRRAAAAAANAGRYTDEQMAAKGFVHVPPKPGPKSKAIIDRTVVTSKSGTKWYKPAGSSSGASGGGATVGEPQLRSQFVAGWTGTKQGEISPGVPDTSKPATPAKWSKNKLKGAIDWIVSRKSSFPKVTKNNATQLRQFLNGIDGLSGTDIDQIVNGVKARL